MVPIDKVKNIINKHISLEKELSAGNIDPKIFAKKSKEYSNLGSIIDTAKSFVKFEDEKRDLEKETGLRFFMKNLKMTTIKLGTLEK